MGPWVLWVRGSIGCQGAWSSHRRTRAPRRTSRTRRTLCWRGVRRESGGTGRRAGLRIRWPRALRGSTPPFASIVRFAHAGIDPFRVSLRQRLNPQRRRLLILSIPLVCFITFIDAQSPSLTPTQALARDIFRELIGIDTTDEHGATTPAAEVIAETPAARPACRRPMSR